MDELKLTERIFWDVDYNKLDPKNDFSFIIERVFDRGDVEDIRECRRYYDHELVTKVLLKAKYISKYRLHLASAVIDKQLNAFRCHTSQQLTKIPSPY